MAAKKATTKPKEIYLVVWDEDGDDPVKKFSSMASAKKFIETSLVNDEDVDTSSITVYKVLEMGRVKVSIELEME